MSIYIYKNNQRTGPFEENAVLVWLRNGQLAGEDLACRAGESNWRPLKTLFPITDDIQPVHSAGQAHLHTPSSNVLPQNKKSGGSKFLLFVLLGIGGLLLIGVVGIVAFMGFLVGKTTDSRGLSNNTSNRSNSNNSSSASNVPRFKAMADKAEELAKLSPPVNLNPNAIIKGKVAIVKKDESGRAEVKGFDAYQKEYNELDLKDYGLTKQRMAAKPEEIDTLIQILCAKGKSVGHYTRGIEAFANVCKVSIIDYRVPAVIAQNTFTNDKPDEKIKTYGSTSEYVLYAPTEIKKYAASFPLEKLTASSTETNADRNGSPKFKAFMDTAPELARVALPVNLNDNPTIKGKVAVVRNDSVGRFELKGFDYKGEDYTTYNETFGIPKEKLAVKTDEIDTLIRVICAKGTQIGSVKGVTVYANKCEVSLVDFKASTVIAQKIFENKQWDRDIDTELYKHGYVALSPDQEIEEYIKQLPTA